MLDQIALYIKGGKDELRLPAQLSGGGYAGAYQRLFRQTLHLNRNGEKALCADIGKLAESLVPKNEREALLLARLAFLVDMHDRAEELRQQFADRSLDNNWMLINAALEFRRENLEAAATEAARYAEEWTVMVMGAPLGEAPNLCVLREKPVLVSNPFGELNIRFGGSFIGQLINHFPRRYRYFSLFVDAPSTAPAQQVMRPPDVMLNSIINGETLGDPSLREDLEAAIGRWDVPCINLPSAAYDTARDKLPKLLGETPEQSSAIQALQCRSSTCNRKPETDHERLCELPIECRLIPPGGDLSSQGWGTVKAERSPPIIPHIANHLAVVGRVIGQFARAFQLGDGGLGCADGVKIRIKPFLAVPTSRFGISERCTEKLLPQRSG